MADLRTGERPDVIDEIQQDHEEVKRLLERVADRNGPDRAAAFEQLARLITMHEAAEQEVVHPVVEHLSEQVADQRLEEEAKGDQLLHRLQAMSPDDPSFDELFAKFRSAVLAHATHEEQEEHPQLRENLDDFQRQQMGEAFAKAERRNEPQS